MNSYALSSSHRAHSRASQGKQVCPLCQRTFQQRHFRLRVSDGEQREHVCRGCSQKHKVLKTLVRKGMAQQQCVDSPRSLSDRSGIVGTV